MKKGVLFTISLVLIVSVVLALAVLNFQNSQTTTERLSDIGGLDRLSNIISSISTGFKEVFYAYSGINVTINKENVTFEEFLPNNNATKFKNTLDDYKNYIENQDATIKLNVSKLKSDLSLLILPHNISYKHNSYGGNQIIINPDQLNINKYYVDIQPSFNITSCIWNTFSGTLTFELKTNNPSCDGLVNLNPNQNNSININNGGFLININNSLYMTNSLSSVKVKTTMSLNKIIGERITVWSDKNVININYQNLNISKSSGFRII